VAKRVFESFKNELATSFLAKPDQEITGGRISDLTKDTGGVKIVWNKTLRSTAGRANWRKEVSVKKSVDGVESKHHASIDLAVKVVDGENRLLNVLAHEFSHLATFIISGVKDNPHGKEFKEWAAKCMSAFEHRGVQVRTKHSYSIGYKYVWECVNCGQEFKRHSKSIDPQKHYCGSCKSNLVRKSYSRVSPRSLRLTRWTLKAHIDFFANTKCRLGPCAHPNVPRL
jgi:predicted SprT family Zn-dependent metalloprotease